MRKTNVKNIDNDLNYDDTDSTIHDIHLGVGIDMAIKPNGSSGPRVNMYFGHGVQQIHTVGAEPRTCFTGKELKYAKAMFNVKITEDCTVKRVFHRREFSNANRILETTIFVENLNDKTIHSYNIPAYETNHQVFGYEYKNIKNINVGQRLHKNEVIAECPSVIDGEFCQGVMANVIFISSNDVIEDAVVKSTSLADRMLSYGYKKIRGHIGSGQVPLYLYGTEDTPRFHPAVGEMVRDDGILFALRDVDDELAAVELSDIALYEIDTHTDYPYVVDVNSEVIDVKVYRNQLRVKNGEDGADVPHHKMHTLSKQQAILDEEYSGCSHYYKAIRDYYQELRRDTERRMRKNEVPEYNVSPEAHVAFLDAIAVDSTEVCGPGSLKNLLFNRILMEDYVIEITVKYPIPFDESAKSTDLAGGKGVCGKVTRTELMPIDDYGNRVELMMSDNAVSRRTNFNRPFEAYMGAAARDVRLDIIGMIEENRYDEAWDYLIRFLDCASPEYRDTVERVKHTKALQHQYLDSLMDNRLRVQFPSFSRKPMDIAERDVERHFPPRRSKLTFYDELGNECRTEKEFIVGEIYMMRLQQTGREFSSVSACKYQQFGTIATPHAQDKQQTHSSEKPIRFVGNSEWRMLQAYIGGTVCAEIHDISNNPLVHSEIVKNILTAPVPTNIESVIDREKYPLGANRIKSMVDSTFECEGFRFTDSNKNLS